MDSNLKDESRNRHREEALARWLGDALDQAAPQTTESCPDAELMAAYHERALNPEETTLCETHFATCSRCRKILAVLAASDDTPLAEKEVARLGELVAAATQPIKTIGPKRWDWRMRWLAPALGVAAVLAVWFVVKPPWRGVNEGSTRTLVAEGPKSELQPTAQLPPTDQLSKEPAKDDKAINENAATSTPSKDLGAANSSLDSLIPHDGTRERTLQEDRKGEAKLDAAPNGQAGPLSVPPPPPPAPRAFVAAAAPGAPPAAQSPPQTVTVTGEAPAISSADSAGGEAADKSKQAPRPAIVGGVITGRSAPDAPLNGRGLKTFAALSKAPAEISLILKSSAGTSLWRAGRGGLIERSIDNGRTWIPQTSPSQQDWLAGSAVSDTVCWLVGRNGAIARTTDGEQWDKITSPQIAAGASGKFPDWTSITATSDQSAIIVSADQGRYSTEDGGKTWLAQ